MLRYRIPTTPQSLAILLSFLASSTVLVLLAAQRSSIGFDVGNSQTLLNNCLREDDVLILTICDLGSGTLCLYCKGGKFVVPEESFSLPRLSCLNRVSGGASLQALSLPSSRILVFPNSTLINWSIEEEVQLRRELRSIPHAIRCQDPSSTKSASFSHLCWSATQQHRQIFERACSAINENALQDGAQIPLLEFLDLTKFAFARFPKHKFTFDGNAVYVTESHYIELNENYAFVTFISSKTHDWYVESVRMMWDSMKLFCKSKIEEVDFVVMLLRSGPSAVNEDAFAELLISEGMKVSYVEDIVSTAQRPDRFIGIWGKQRFWSLSAYSKVVFVDPDQLLLKCPTDVLGYPPWTHAAVGDSFNSGVMIARPSPSMMSEVEAHVKTMGISNDQSLTEIYFDNRGYVIPEYWSFYKRHAYQNHREWDMWKHCSSYIHFTGEKPWEEVPRGTEKSVKLFFQMYEQFKIREKAGPEFIAPRSTSDEPEDIDFSSCPDGGLPSY